MVVLGDSMSINLFCALSCAMLQNGTVLRESRSIAQLPGKSVMRMVSLTSGYSAHWLVPECAGGAHFRCLYGHSAGSGACGQQTLDFVAEPKVARRHEFVVIHTPCGAHHQHFALPAIATALINESYAGFAAWPDLLLSACAQSHAICPGNATLQTQGGIGDSASRSATTMRDVMAANRGSLAMLLESMPAHNPILPGCHASAIRGVQPDQVSDLDEHEWEGYVVGTIEYARQLLRRWPEVGREVFTRVGITEGSLHLIVKDSLLLAGLHAAEHVRQACLRAMNAPPQPACHSGAQQQPQYPMEPSGDLANCWLRGLPRPPNATRSWHPRWRDTFNPGWCAARTTSLGGGGWRQAAERRAAAAFDVPILLRSDARESRWDLHPGIQSDPPNYFDCKHSTFAPGAFDAEVVGFLAALEARFGAQ